MNGWKSLRMGLSSLNLPGGGVEENEDPQVGAIREVEEETGVKLLSVEKLGDFLPLSSHTDEQVSLF